MNKIFAISLIVLINIFFINASLGQSQLKYKTFNQENFKKNKILDEVYNLWKHKNNWFSYSKDSICYFVDDRHYKGIINYGVTFRSKNYKSFNFIENLSMCYLKVEISKCDYNPKDSIVNIEGFVSGNGDWGSNELVRTKKTQDHIHILLGEKKDTIKTCFLGKIVNKDTVEVKLNNKEIDEFTVLDTFPAFYFKNYSYYRTILEGRHPFKISGKVTKNTLLAFGSGACYSEIFDLGSMIYYPNENRLKKIIQKEELDCKPIIIQNKLTADIENEKSKVLPLYYQFTDKAESYILLNQYAKAKEQYNLLSQNYPTLFARDIHNSIRCAILSRDFKTAFMWSEKLALKGIELSYFNSKIFNGMRKNLEWKTFSIKYDSLCKLTKKNWNIKLKRELTDLLNEDQADYGLESRKDSKVLYETTERVTSKLIDLLKREGYPSEEKIGAYVEKDTVLISSPDYNVLIIHARQQKTKNLAVLNELLDKSSTILEYDSKRNGINVVSYNSCLHIYKGNLYNSKTCVNNDLTVKKIIFKFSNPNNFITVNNDYIITGYNKNNPKEDDKYYEENFNFIIKLTDDLEFYEK